VLHFVGTIRDAIGYYRVLYGYRVLWGTIGYYMVIGYYGVLLRTALTLCATYCAVLLCHSRRPPADYVEVKVSPKALPSTVGGWYVRLANPGGSAGADVHTSERKRHGRLDARDHWASCALCSGQILICFENKWVGQLTFKPDTNVRAGG
jgi:hypothetical protein